MISRPQNGPSTQDGDAKWIVRLSWGALLLTPFWLLLNGFLLSLLLYLVLYLVASPLCWVMAVVFLLRGNRWSWGDGRRWPSLQQFAEEQYVWNYMSACTAAAWLTVLLLAWLL